MALRKPVVRLGEACDRYLERIEREGHAATTQRTTTYALTRFKKAVASRREPDPLLHTITAEMMDDYCYGRNGLRSGDRGITASTFNRYRASLKVFWDYALTMGWVDANPMRGIGPARPEAPKPKLMLSAGELIALLDSCSNPVQRIACSIAMNTGLRSNDIRQLTVFDAVLSSGYIQTEIRKTKKIDNKPITMELHWELSKWLNTYADLMDLPSRDDLPSDWLLVPTYRTPAPNARDRRIKPRPTMMITNPWRMVQGPLERMGYPTKGEGFHTLRRSSARALFESLRSAGEGRDHALMVVKEFLNHSSVVQTEHYLGLNQERAIRDTLLKDRPFLSALAEQEQARASDEKRASG
jgi:integrase